MKKTNNQSNDLHVPSTNSKNMLAIEHETAIWLFRAVIANITPRFLKQDVDDFLEYAGDNLVWSEPATKLIKSKLAEFDKTSDDLSGHLSMVEIYEARSSIGNNAFRELVSCNRPVVKAMLKKSLNRLESIPINKFDPLRDNIQHLKSLLDLNETESAILMYIGRAAQSRMADDLLRTIKCGSRESAARHLATILSLKDSDIMKAIKKNSRLNEYKLIVIDRKPGDLEDFIKGEDILYDCLSEPYENLDDLILNFIKPAGKTTLAIDDFPHLMADHSAIQGFMQGVSSTGTDGINFLLYGEPGTGKTEYAKLLAHEAGFNLYEVAFTDKNDEALSRSARLASLTIAQRFLASKPNSMILFDEIEDVFPSGGGGMFAELFGGSSRAPSTTSKAWINRFLETNKTPVIWVSNEINQIDPAYLRRYSYHLEFRTPPISVRSKIANKYLGELPITPSFIKHVSEDDSLTPAQVEKAAQFVALSGITEVKDAEALARRVINSCKRVMGTGRTGKSRASSTEYDLSHLNIESRYPIDKIVRALETTQNSSLCFYGSPGTGKTALAEHIAKAVNKPLLVKRASDILSKWVGEAEKNIAEMFQEAESEGAILFLDEADSLLRDRKTSKYSWEVTQVNEMLQQMEAFDGIFICATNLFGDLDQAALRRFSFKLLFNPMTVAKRNRMFIQEALGGDDGLLDANIQSGLAKLNLLTPGDFAVVKRQARVMGEEISAYEFLKTLEAEHALKPASESKRVGFIG